MVRHRRHPWPMIVSLLVFVGIAASLVIIGGRMAMFRAAERDKADVVQATVLNVDRRTTTDSDGSRSTSYSILVELNLNGEILERILVAANFEPDDIWFTSDQVDLGLYQTGELVDVLTRPDLDYRTTPADWEAAYLTAVILMAFGGFILAFLSLWSWLMFR